MDVPVAGLRPDGIRNGGTGVVDDVLGGGPSSRGSSRASSRGRGGR